MSLQLLGVDAHSLQEGLTYRKIEAKNEQVSLTYIYDNICFYLNLFCSG